MHRLLPALIFILIASAVGAGPWPREAGAVFLATGGTYRFDLATGLPTGEATVYAEYGLTRRITLGFDGMQSDAGAVQALVFARVPLGREDRRLKLALELSWRIPTGMVDAARRAPDNGGLTQRRENLRWHRIET